MKFHVHIVRGKAKRETVCVGSEVTTVGIFKGRIRFRGEHGYTRVKARRAPGGIGYQESHCGGTPTNQITELVAKSTTTRFLAIRDFTYGITAFLASEREKRGRVLINRSALRLARHGSEFSFNDGLTSAHVEPLGSLFSGSADFTAPDGWDGPLAVSFPGDVSVPLTGPDFTAKLRSFLAKESRRGWSALRL